MKAALALLLLFATTAQGAAPALSAKISRETWEICLDEGDFTFSANDAFKSTRAVKTGCLVRLVESGGKGTKLEVNLCDPAIRIQQFAAVEDTSATALFAGSAGCEAPLFGADIGVPAGSGPAYLAAREQVFRLLAAVEKVYGKSGSVDFQKVRSPGDAGSHARIACARLLLEEYLNRCSSFPASRPKP